MNNPEHTSGLKKIALWGVGDWGIRIAGTLPLEYQGQVKIVALDSDMQSLICSPITNKVVMGGDITCGLGTGGDLEKATRAFRESEDKIRAELNDTDILLIVGGVGGGVGSAVIPLLCDCAVTENKYTLVFISRPFDFEGKKKHIYFQEVRERILGSKVGLASFSMDRLVGRVDDEVLHDEVFDRCDRILKKSVETVIAYLSAAPPRGGDYASLKRLLTHAGEMVMGTGEVEDPEELTDAIKGAISGLALSASELKSVRGFLVQFESGNPLPFRGIEKAIKVLSGLMAEDSDLLYFISDNQVAGGKSIVRILAAGIPDKKKSGIYTEPKVTLNIKASPSKQTTFDFNKYTRGVFAETDPNLSEGEDLDIPTFVRKGMSLD